MEGPDGGGKSTLGEALSNVLGVPVNHDGGPSTDEHHARVRMHQFLTYENTIRDRSTLFSDAIYKKAFGKTPFVPDEEVDSLVDMAAKRGTLMIYVRPPADVLIRNAEFLARAKPHKPPEYANQLRALIPNLVEEYDRSVRRWQLIGLSVLRYDYTCTKIDEFIQDVKRHWWEKN